MATQRLFFALELPDSLQQQLVRWRAENFAEDDGKPVAAANLHLTLAFLGEVSSETSQKLQQLAARIVQPGFTLNLDDAGHWPRPGVVWLGCQRAPPRIIAVSEFAACPSGMSRMCAKCAAFSPTYHLIAKCHAKSSTACTRLSLAS